MMTSDLLISRLNAVKPTQEEIAFLSPELNEENIVGVLAFFDFHTYNEPKPFQDELRTLIYNTNLPQLGISDFNFDLDSNSEIFCSDDQGYNFIVDGALFALRYDDEPLHWSTDIEGFFEGLIALFHAHMDFTFRKPAFKTARYLRAIELQVEDKVLATFFSDRITDSFPE